MLPSLVNVATEPCSSGRTPQKSIKLSSCVKLGAFRTAASILRHGIGEMCVPFKLGVVLVSCCFLAPLDISSTGFQNQMLWGHLPWAGEYDQDFESLFFREGLYGCDLSPACGSLFQGWGSSRDCISALPSHLSLCGFFSLYPYVKSVLLVFSLFSEIVQ